MHAELYYTETIKLNMKDIVSVIELSFMVAIMLCPHKLVGCIGAEMLIKVSTNDCICPGNIVTYECTVFGGSGTSTVWKSNFFQCSSGKELVLVHRLLSEGEESHARICNDGDTVGRIVRIENNYFTSQLNVTLTAGIAGESIKCIGDNGTNTHRIGLLNLTTATAAAIQSPLPPQNISWLISYQKLYKFMIAFQWNTHPPNCHPTYNILSSNCGLCPTTTNQTTVTCTDVPTDDGVCMLAVQTVVCGRFVGELSPYVSVQVFDDKGSYSSRNSSALVSAIILGVALTISLIGFATVTIILLMKTKIKVQTGAMTVTSESRKNENRSNISTNKNIAYVVHSPKQI